MDVRDKEEWEKFVNYLVYPSLLGSMMFKAFEVPFRPPVDWWLFVALAAIILANSVDYMHLWGDGLKKGHSLTGVNVALDIVIALSFCISFHSLTRGYVLTSAVFYMFFPIGLRLYNLTPELRKNCLYTIGRHLLFIPAAVFVITAIKCGRCWEDVREIIAYLLSAQVAIYAVIVFLVVGKKTAV